MLRVAVLVSGGGTNLQAIIDAVGNGTITNTELVGVISNIRTHMHSQEPGIIRSRHSAFRRRILRQEKSLTKFFLKR